MLAEDNDLDQIITKRGEGFYVRRDILYNTQ